jgi:hypothetical protein
MYRLSTKFPCGGVEPRAEKGGIFYHIISLVPVQMLIKKPTFYGENEHAFAVSTSFRYGATVGLPHLMLAR